MKATHQSGANRQSGFSVFEVVLAVSLFIVVTAVIVPTYTWGMRIARGGSLQAQFTIAARESELKLGRYVQSGKAVAVFSNLVEISTTSNTVCSISYVDLDGDPSTLSNNVIRFDPNINTVGGEVTVCSWVSSNPGEPLFTNVNLSPMAVRFSYHIGEGTNFSYASAFSSSPGYQGVDVRFAATPRNLQTWYQ